MQRAYLDAETKVVRLPLLEGPAPARLVINDTHFLFTADFKKSGPDLILTGDDGKKLVIANYFNFEKHPDLVSPDGAVISAELVERLAGPEAPGQYAQAGAPAGAVVIGRVEIVSVNATVQHANGVVDNLKNGDSLLKGDVVMTGDGEGCTLSLIDGTALNMGSNGRMVLAELTYDLQSTSNSALINLVKGSFVFVAGQVAHTGDMRVSTPVATMGIRGTTVGTYLDADVNGNVYELTATLLTDPGGSSGAYDLLDPVTGAVLHRVRSTATQVTLSYGANNQLSMQEASKSPAILQHEIAVAQILFPIFLANPNNAQLNQTTPQAPNNSLTPPQLLPQPPQETDPNSAVHFNLLLIGGNDAPVTQGATATNSLVLTPTPETNVLQSVINATLTFADTNIGRTNAAAVQFAVGGLNNAGSGTITFSDGNHTHDVVVQIVNGLPASSTVNLSGLSDGPITATLSASDPAGNTFQATATAQLDQDLDEHPTVAFAVANIGKANAGTVQFTVNGLEHDDSGTITFSDGNRAHDVVVNIVNGVPVSNSVNLSGLSDGPITATLSTSDPQGNTFNATATARLDQDLDEHPTVAFALANIGKANAGTVQFTVNGLEPDDNGTITFSDGTHNVVVNIVNGAPVSPSVNLSGLSDGPITATLSASDPAGNTFNVTATARLDQDLDEHPTVAFALANIGKANAGTVQFTVNGLEPDDNGTITFSDGTHNVVVNIVKGAPVSTSVNLSGLSDGPITATLSASDPAGNTFSAHASTQLDQDLNESPTLAFADANIGRAKAASEQFTVAGLESDDNGAITFSDGTHNVVVNIVNGAPVSTSVNLSGMTDGLVTALLSVSDAAGNTFSAHASAQLEQSLGKSVTVTFTDANIGRVKAASEQFTVSGLGSDDNGAITFSDGTHNVVVSIVNGAPVSPSVNLSGMTDGPITATLLVSDAAGNTFSAHASAQLDQDLNESPTLAFAQANIGRAQAGTAAFMVAGLEFDDNGTITFSDGTHNVVVNIVNGAPVSPSVNLSGLSDGPITATLSASDPAGNTFNVTATARLDQDLDEHPTVAFALANIGKANAGTVQFTVNGLEPDDNGTITFSDGTHNVVVNIVKGAPVSTSVNLSGLSDGPITATLSASDPAGNTFSAHASTQLDQDLNESPTLAFADANIGRAKAASEQFTVAGLEFDDNGAITFSDGTHNVVVNIVNGAPVSTSVNLSGMTDGLVTALLSVSDAAGNTFSAHASAQLDQDIGEQIVVGLSGLSGGYALEDKKITATVTDTDNDVGPSGVHYTWQVSLDGGTTWSTVGSNGNTYTPVEADEGRLLQVTASFTDLAGNIESGSTIVGVLPFLAIADNSLSVSPGGTTPLGISLALEPVPDDTISVKISFTSSGANSPTILAGDGAHNHSTSGGITTYTFSQADVISGLSFTNHGDQTDALTVSELLNGDVASTQTITVTDPPVADAVASDSSSTILSGTTLTLAGASAETITFANDKGDAGTLVLDHSASFTGQISGFAGDGTLSNSDSIDLKDIDFAAAKETYSGGILTVTDDAHTANLHFDGDYVLGNFVLASDDHGGTLVIDPPAPVDLTARFEPDHSDTGLQEAHGLAQEQTFSGFPLATADATFDQFHFGNMDLTGFNGHAHDLVPAISSFGSDHFQFAVMDTDGFHQTLMVHPLELDLHQAPLQTIVEAAAPGMHDVTPAAAELSPAASVLDIIHAIHAHTA